MKKIVVLLTKKEWEEVLINVKHEYGEWFVEKEVEQIVKREVAKFIRDTYIRGLQ